jgi:hypothetical protein
VRVLLVLAAVFLSPGLAPPSQAASRSPCAPFNSAGNHRWIPGDYKVVPVSAQNQKQAMQRLTRGAVEEVSEAVARRMTGHAALPPAAHYYRARVGYVGSAVAGTIPVGVDLSADVDAEGVAYVTSFRLSRSREKSEAAAILTSATPLRSVVSICGAAK